MEKRKPHYPLARIKTLIIEGAYMATETAMMCASEDFRLFEESQLAEYVLVLEHKHFYKSITVRGNSRLWQDANH